MQPLGVNCDWSLHISRCSPRLPSLANVFHFSVQLITRPGSAFLTSRCIIPEYPFLYSCPRWSALCVLMRCVGLLLLCCLFITHVSVLTLQCPWQSACLSLCNPADVSVSSAFFCILLFPCVVCRASLSLFVFPSVSVCLSLLLSFCFSVNYLNVSIFYALSLSQSNAKSDNNSFR